MLKLVTWDDGHVVQAKNPKWLTKGYVYFSISQGHNQVGIKIFWYELVKHVLYCVESAAALDEFKYFLHKSCW